MKDKTSQKWAHAPGIVVPASAIELDSIAECNEEWRLYVDWWSTSDETRNNFCMIEQLFLERNDEVRRNAEKSSVSTRIRQALAKLKA